jgi:hypothetical protein
MKPARLLSLIVLGAAPLALAVVTACNTTTFVDVPFDGGADTAAAVDPDATTLPDAATEATTDGAGPDAPDGKCHPISASGMPPGTYEPPTGGSSRA